MINEASLLGLIAMKGLFGNVFVVIRGNMNIPSKETKKQSSLS